VAASGSEPSTVFISWAHRHADWDDARAAQWADTVHGFARLLRENGVDADIDLWHLSDTAVDWTRWGPRRAQECAYVVVTVSSAWRERWEGRNNPTEGAGAAAESDALKGLFQRHQTEFQRRVVVVLLPGASPDDVPPDLARLNRFRIDSLDDTGVEDLLRALTHQPAFLPPGVGPLRKLPPLTPDSDGRQETAPSSLRLGPVRVDSERSGWEQGSSDPTSYYLFPRRPDYMNFIRVNWLLRAFHEIDHEYQEMFEEVLRYTRQSAAESTRGANDVDALEGISPADLYVASVMMHRAPQVLESGQRVLDLTDEAQEWDCDVANGFYRYDLEAMRALVPQIRNTKWFAAEAETDRTQSAIRLYRSTFMRTSDLVFDLSVINDGIRTEVISTIVVEVLGAAVEFRAGPKAERVEIAATYNFDLYLDRRESAFDLDPPIAVGADRVARFHVRFRIRRSPGNVVRLRLRVLGTGEPLASTALRLSM
jgi:hypothetical protein